MTSDDLVQFRHLSKVYPGTVAVDDVSFGVRAGEVHAVIGENGAGKSTLIKMLSGAVQPSKGEIYFESEVIADFSPKASIERGISVIYQEFNLVPEMTIAENVFLGREFKSGIFVKISEANYQTRQLLETWNVRLDPRSSVSQLSVAEQQIVEIIKSISQDVKLLIMDEPTASLTLEEVNTLFRLTRQLAARGVTIIYISHRLEEIFEICDRVTVLRDGRHIATKEVANTNRDELIQLMVGRVIGQYPDKEPPTKEAVLSVRDLSDGHVFDGISFDLHRGEILGLYALIGAGRTDVAMTIFGAKKRKMGEIRLHDEVHKIDSPMRAVRLGLGLVPEDRKGQGLVMSMLSSANISLSAIDKLSARTLVRRDQEKKLVSHYQGKLKLQSHVPNEEAQNLSGGTQQKVVLAKMLARDADIILFDEPTRGIDVGAKHEIYELMAQLCAEGKAILMISSEMLELLGMADRILVMRDGRLSGEFSRAEATEEKLLFAAANTASERGNGK